MELVLGKLETLDNPSTILRNPSTVPLLGIAKKRVVLTKIRKISNHSILTFARKRESEFWDKGFPVFGIVHIGDLRSRDDQGAEK